MHSGLHPRSLLILLFLLIPSAAYLWHFDDLPQFGDFHDDGIYFVSAKSLASSPQASTSDPAAPTPGYRILSLPGEPTQTKYPPLYPLLLSAAWRIDPQFPRNLPIAAWISWLALPAVMIQLAAYFPRLGVSGWRAWLLLSALAFNPYIIYFSSQLLSELPFLALILSTMLLVDTRGHKAAFVAGLVAGLAYLTRSAGIIMFPAAIAYFWIKKDKVKAALFAAAMLPFIAGWMLWARLHQTLAPDPVMLYYTDYLGYQLYNVTLRTAPIVVWKNIDSLMWSLGGLVLPKVAEWNLLRIASWIIGAAMISGTVRIVRRGHGLLYALFGLATILALLVWHFPPNERFLLPLLPLALAGLLTELEHIASALNTGLQHRQLSQRIAAGLLSSIVILALGASAALQIYVSFAALPDRAHDSRLLKIDRITAYAWIMTHVPMESAFLATDDPVLYLYTGRHAIRNQVPPRLWYRADRAAMVQWMANPAPFSRNHRLTYLEFSGVDTSYGLPDQDRLAVERSIPSNPDYAELYKTGPVTIYGLR